ncbi:SMI1/KNR4 family protein [Anaerocolumna jejuensis]|uniref:SMI1/KNR4 family protein n=1 Tax=Anaerocolumna jejuensis TaxID=259063 RepID=UPI003F7BCBDE
MYSFIKEIRPGFEITPEEIHEIEENYEIRFPQALVQFYLECNGAEAKLCYFEADEDEDDEDDEYEDADDNDFEEDDEDFEDGNDDFEEDDDDFEYEDYPYEVRSIVPLRYGRLTFEQIIDNDRDYMDNNMFPIAGNQGGDCYYWNKNSEKIYLYYCDDIEEPIFICHTVKRFFEKLSDAVVQAEGFEKGNKDK